MEDVAIFYGHLVHFTVFSYILATFCIVRGNLVYFSRFGILYQEKSGNPDLSFLPSKSRVPDPSSSTSSMMLSRSSFVCEQHQVLWYSNYIKKPGANPTIVAYNASAVPTKIYHATCSFVRFEKKICFEKRSSLLILCSCSCKFNL
jgi:hypothetical protein